MKKLYKESDIIRAIDKHTKDTPHGLVLDEDITIILEEMKSVEPDASDCWGCNCPKMERKTFSEMVHLHDAETHSCDCISRQAAIDELNNHLDTIPLVNNTDAEMIRRDEIMDCRDIIQQLPSAQPEVDEWCTDCKEYDSERHCCPRYNRVILEAIEEAKADDDWIPVKKRLPEESGTYFVTHHPDYVPVGCIQTDTLDFEDGAWYWWNEKGELEKWDDPIIAWKPMPEPWKGEESEE